MTKMRLMVTVCFLVAFAAGTTLGMLVRRPPERVHHGRSYLARELDLTLEQQEQVSKIWRETTRAAQQQQREQRDDLQRARDEAICSRLSVEQALWYDEVMKEYARALAEGSQLRRRMTEDAVKRTKEVLNEEQRAKYEKLLQARTERGSSRGASENAVKDADARSGDK
jgi:Spy/CpxP family protein refolding chaperone